MTTPAYLTASDDVSLQGIWQKHIGSIQTLLYPKVDFTQSTVTGLFYGTGSQAVPVCALDSKLNSTAL